MSKIISNRQRNRRFEKALNDLYVQIYKELGLNSNIITKNVLKFASQNKAIKGENKNYTIRNNESFNDQPIVTNITNGLRPTFKSFETDFQSELKRICLSHKVSHSFINELLSLLKTKLDFLPTNSKTLLETERFPCNVLQIGDEEIDCKLTYFGLKNGLINYLENGFCPNIINDIGYFQLKFNFDGTEISKSSKLIAWPILVMIRNYDCQPYMVSLVTVKDRSKPPILSKYLYHLIEELKLLSKNGFYYNNILFKVDYNVCLFNRLLFNYNWSIKYFIFRSG